jgi:hypothetical protein
MLLTEKVDPPGLYEASLDKGEVATLKAVYWEQYTEEISKIGEDEDLPEVDEATDIILDLETAKDASIEVSGVAIGGIVRRLEVFRDATPERVRFIARNTNVHDHRNSIWNERRKLGVSAEKLRESFSSQFAALFERNFTSETSEGGGTESTVLLEEKTGGKQAIQEQEASK